MKAKNRPGKRTADVFSDLGSDPTHMALLQARRKSVLDVVDRRFQAINRKMHDGMDITFTGKADVDFVKGMIPHNRLGRSILRKLHVYKGSKHPHEAQAPAPLQVNKVKVK